MSSIKIAVQNQFVGLTDQQVQAVVDALQIQVHKHFAPAWGIDAEITFYPKGALPRGAWQLIILDNSDQAGALGYHDLTSEGLPLGKVFAGTDLKYGTSWSVTASHELLEMLGDPDINLTVFVENKAGTGVLYAYENCDACEDDSFAYLINGIKVSDFVFPSWFQKFHLPGTQFDYGKHITQPFELLQGGYIGIYDIESGSGWQQKYPADQVLKYSMRAHIGSRRERRKTQKSQWLKSTGFGAARFAEENLRVVRFTVAFSGGVGSLKIQIPGHPDIDFDDDGHREVSLPQGNTQYVASGAAAPEGSAVLTITGDVITDSPQKYGSGLIHPNIHPMLVTS